MSCTGTAMRLTGKVVELHDGSKYTDGKPRIRVRFPDALGLWNELLLDRPEGVTLGEEVTFILETEPF